MYVGANIKKRRQELQMSQQELADAMGYKTRSTIAKIEAGENDVSQTKLQKFAVALHTTVEALITMGTPPAVETARYPDLTGERRNKNIAVILAGGKFGRNHQNIPSQFINVHGKPIIVYCLEVYQAHPAVDEIYVVCLKGWESIVSAYAKQYGITKLRQILPGGDSGMESLMHVVDGIKDRYDSEDLLIIQESTRPLVEEETVSKLLLACTETGSATMCHSMQEYVQFRMEAGKARYVDRDAMIALQSPEVHRFSLITEVFEKAKIRNAMTESCFAMLLYNLGYHVNFVEGTVNNIKIANDEDIAIFSALVKK